MNSYPISAQQLSISSSKRKETQTGYILNKSEVGRIFETMRFGAINKIYIIYVAFNIKENQ